MHTRNCLNLPYDNNSELNIEKITEIFNSGKKEIIIDYNDWTDTRNVPNNDVLKNSSDENQDNSIQVVLEKKE